MTNETRAMQLEFHQLSTKYSSLRLMLPEQKGRLMASLAEDGQQHPVSVVASDEAQKPFVLIDGYRRVQALEALGRDFVEAIELPMSESDALLFRYQQLSTRKSSALEEGWLCRDLIESHGSSQAELSRRLMRNESWVSRRLALVRELPESVQEVIRQGALTEHSAMKYLVPLARAKRGDCEALVRNLGKTRTSTRQIERLYMSWKTGDADLRRKIVERPLLFLKTVEELQRRRSTETNDGPGPICEDFQIICAVSGRAKRRLERLESAETIAAPIRDAWLGARACFEGLHQKMEKRLHAGSGYEESHLSPEG